MNKEKQNSSNNNKIQKRPISILLVSLLGGAFLLILIIAFFTSNNSFEFVTPLLGLLIIPTFFIISTVLVFINLGKNKRRTKYFIISTVALPVLFVTLLIVDTSTDGSYTKSKVSQSQSNIEEAAPGPELESDIEEITEETGAEEIFEELLPAEEPAKDEAIEETPEEEIVQESEIKFSFDEYIDPSKVREYKMIEEEDIKIKALGDKLFSEYTTEEFDKLPINYRLKCSITIPRDITEEELESTFAQIIKDKSTENIEIDEIYVAAWYFEESVGKTVAMGRAEWCPNGKWEELPPEIAESDIRGSYKIVFYIEIQEYEDELKYGLTESERMQAFYDLVVLQDSIPYDDPEWDEKNDESYEIIAEKYGTTRSQMFAIGVEGITKGWPMPEL